MVAPPRFATHRPRTWAQAPGSTGDRHAGADQTPAATPHASGPDAPAPARRPAYRHHFGPEPHQSGWPNDGPEPSRDAPRGAGEGSAEPGRPRGGGPVARRRRWVGGWAARRPAQTSLPAGAPPSPGPNLREAPGLGFVFALATARLPSPPPKPTNPGARAPRSP